MEAGKRVGIPWYKLTDHCIALDTQTKCTLSFSYPAMCIEQAARSRLSPLVADEIYLGPGLKVPVGKGK